jgi:uronate dehydrogenase
VRRSLEAPDVGFLVVFGVSNNRRSFWRRDGWDRLGYEPEDDAEAFAARVGDEQPYRFHGGDFAR